MSGKNPGLNPLDLQKQLLLAESEINRGLMAGDLTALAAGVRAVTDRAKSLGTIGSSAATLVAGLATFQLDQTAKNRAPSSWLQTILKGVHFASNLWLAVDAKSRDAGRT